MRYEYQMEAPNITKKLRLLSDYLIDNWEEQTDLKIFNNASSDKLTLVHLVCNSLVEGKVALYGVYIDAHLFFYHPDEGLCVEECEHSLKNQKCRIYKVYHYKHDRDNFNF